MRAFFYSAFLFRNGQNAIPSILLPGAEWTECCEWKSKMADGEMSAADSNTSLPEKKSGYTFGHNETLLLISLYQKYEVFFSDVSYKKKAIWQMIADDMKKNGYSPSAINCENRWKCLTSSFRKCEDNNNKSGRGRKECKFYKELAEVYGTGQTWGLLSPLVVSGG